MKFPIYLDYNATTPIDKEVLKEMKISLRENFGNPSSLHIYGEKAKEEIFNSRIKIAHILGLDYKTIFFTSSATESNNITLFGLALGLKKRGNHIISQKTEHPSVLEPLKELQKLGFKVTFLNVDSCGMVDPKDLRKKIIPNTILISIMYANNETGTIEPIEEIGKIAKEKEILFHTDATQALGKEILNLKDLPFDFLSFSAHKLYGPKGIGLLLIKESNLKRFIKPLFYGGGQEEGLRPGTLNLPGIVGLAKALEISKDLMEREKRKYERYSNIFLEIIKNNLKNIRLNGHPKKRLKNTLNFSVKGLDSNFLLKNLKEICFSTGSACHSGKKKKSYVLKSMGVPEDYIFGAIRISFGRFTKKEEVVFSAEKLSKEIKKILK